MNQGMNVRTRGISLIEILIVIVVLGIVVIFVFLNISIQIAKAHDAERKGDMDLMEKFIEEYYLDTGCYPISIPLCNNVFRLNDKTFLSNIPCDPTTNFSYVYVSEINSCPRWFQLYGNLEYIQDKIVDKLGCRNGCGPECQFNYGVSSSNVRLNPFCDTPIPSSSPLPLGGSPLQYVCAPGGECEVFANPELSGCPNIYLDDPTCQNDPCKDKNYRCHDASGKTN